MPHRQRYLFVCINRRPEDDPRGSCAAKGSEQVVLGLKTALAKRGVAKDIVRACSSSCLDMCETGISVVQEPEHVAYGGVTIDDVDAIADAAARGEVVERLVVHGLEEHRRRAKGEGPARSERADPDDEGAHPRPNADPKDDVGR
jgi:(2Fe-2S) ferredoxin